MFNPLIFPEICPAWWLLHKEPRKGIRDIRIPFSCGQKDNFPPLEKLLINTNHFLKSLFEKNTRKLHQKTFGVLSEIGVSHLRERLQNVFIAGYPVLRKYGVYSDGI